MSEQFLIRHASPTLAGIKTGNMFSVKINGDTDIYQEIRELNAILKKKGLRVIPLKRTSTYALIYIYRPGHLRKDLEDPKARRILQDKGYDDCKAEVLITQLVSRINEDEEFPHEIGLFLGYPPADVECFMNNPCSGVECSGCWKAYSNPDKARKTFSRYKKCTDVYQRLNKDGKTLSQLTVMVKNAV